MHAQGIILLSLLQFANTTPLFSQGTLLLIHYSMMKCATQLQYVPVPVAVQYKLLVRLVDAMNQVY